MARRVFFSFHYETDVWRASQIRNSWVTKPDREAAGFWDAAAWEAVKRKGRPAIENWINNQLSGTSVTVVLIGAQTSERYYVQYEINQSWGKKNGLIGIYIHKLKTMSGNTSFKGNDPFVRLGYKGIYTYDWVTDNGYANLGYWVESAYKRALSRNS
jgi:hypothetical protein